MRYVSRCTANSSALGPKESPETSSRPSELQQRTIDVRTCCDGVVARLIAPVVTATLISLSLAHHVLVSMCFRSEVLLGVI